MTPRTTRQLIVATLAAIVTAEPGFGATLTSLLERTVQGDVGVEVAQGVERFARPIANALGDSIGRALPFTAASAAVTYRFDPESGTFEPDRELAGQLFLERPESLGDGQFQLAVNYQWVRIDTLNGSDIRDLHDSGAPIDGVFTIPQFSIDLETHMIAASASYGVTDRLDLSLTVPLLHTHLGVRQTITQVDSAAFAEPLTFPLRAEGSKLGIGDVLVRGKYRLLDGKWLHGAAGLALRLPVGNEKNFQGTGTTDVAPMLYGATAPWRPVRWFQLRPFVNAGLNFITDDVDRSELRWGIGLDAAFYKRWTVGVAALGRNPFARAEPPGTFDVARVDPRTGTIVVQPRLGLSGERPDFYDFAASVKIDLWRHKVIGFANVILPLNRDGFRSDVIPLVGVESTF